MPPPPSPDTFLVRNLSVLSYAQGFTLWHYRATARGEDPLHPGFFDEAADLFAPGDMVLLSVPSAGALLFVAATAPLVLTPLAANLPPQPSSQQAA